MKERYSYNRSESNANQDINYGSDILYNSESKEELHAKNPDITISIIFNNLFILAFEECSVNQQSWKAILREYPELIKYKDSLNGFGVLACAMMIAPTNMQDESTQAIDILYDYYITPNTNKYLLDNNEEDNHRLSWPYQAFTSTFIWHDSSEKEKIPITEKRNEIIKEASKYMTTPLMLFNNFFYLKRYVESNIETLTNFAVILEHPKYTGTVHVTPIYVAKSGDQIFFIVLDSLGEFFPLLDIKPGKYKAKIIFNPFTLQVSDNGCFDSAIRLLLSIDKDKENFIKFIIEDSVSIHSNYEEKKQQEQIQQIKKSCMINQELIYDRLIMSIDQAKRFKVEPKLIKEMHEVTLIQRIYLLTKLPPLMLMYTESYETLRMHRHLEGYSNIIEIIEKNPKLAKHIEYRSDTANIKLFDNNKGKDYSLYRYKTLPFQRNTDAITLDDIERINNICNLLPCSLVLNTENNVLMQF